MNARQAYQQAAVRGATPVRLTVLLYEQVTQDLTHAIDALAQHRIEEFAQELNHAASVVAYLHATLDRAAGGSVAQNLEAFYSMVREKLLEAQVCLSRETLEELRGHMLDVRESWLKVDSGAND
jgi:flagellar secretion chaperone FliS